MSTIQIHPSWQELKIDLLLMMTTMTIVIQKNASGPEVSNGKKRWFIAHGNKAEFI